MLEQRKRIGSVAAALLLASAVSGCAGWGGGGGGGGGADSVTVLMVNNPQMVDLQKLTADNFTKQTGIKVNYTVLPENDVRDKISQEFSSQAGQYDVASLSNFEIPIYATSKWIAPLSDYIAK
ncbi:MAG TPA: extracellular solute-binding protein, partial [Kribbella sp.]